MKKYILILILLFTLTLCGSFENLSSNPSVIAGSGTLISNNLNFYAPVPTCYLKNKKDKYQLQINYLLPYELKEFQTTEVMFKTKLPYFSLLGGVNYFGDNNYSELSLLISPSFKLTKTKIIETNIAPLLNYNYLKNIYKKQGAFSFGFATSSVLKNIVFATSVLNLVSQKINRNYLPLTIIADLKYKLTQHLSLLSGIEKTERYPLNWRCGFNYAFNKDFNFSISSKNPDFQIATGLEYYFNNLGINIAISWHEELAISYATGLILKL